MNPRHAMARLAAILMLVAAHCELLAQATQAGYEAKLKEAREHAAQESWSLARDAYAAALPLAPDEEATRWTNLWLTDARWRSAGEPDDWQAHRRWREKHKAAFDALLAPYSEKSQRDDIWVAAMRSRLEFQMEMNERQESATALLEIADHLGSRPRDPGAVDSYIEIVLYGSSDPLQSIWGESDDRERWQANLERAVELARNAEERATILLIATRTRATFVYEGIDRQAARWDVAAAAAKGTSIEPLADALRFLFYTRSGYDPSVTEETPAEIPAVIAETSSHLARLGKIEQPSGRGATPLARALQEATTGTEDLRKALTSPKLILDAPEELAPGEPLKLRYGGAGSTELRITVLGQPPENWALAPVRGKNVGGPAGSFQYADERTVETIRSGADAVLHEQVISFPEASNLAWRAGEVHLAERLDPGFYTVLAEASGPKGTVAWKRDIIMTDIAATSISVRPGGTAFLFREKQSNRPFAGEAVRGAIRAESNSISLEGTTDAEGVLTTMEGIAEGYWASNRLIAFVGQRPVSVPFSRKEVLSASLLLADVILDRPLYRPGETVHWKLILRERTEGMFKVSRTRVFLRAQDANGETLVDRLAVDPGEYGTAHGSFVISESARPGECSLWFQTTNDANRRNWIGSGSFLVDNFVPPAITSAIELASPAYSLQPGGEVRIRVRSTYFSGGPVVGAKVTLRLEATPGWEYWQARRESGATEDDWVERLESEVRTGETDGNGVAEFSISLPAEVPDSTNLEVNADVAPSGAQASHANEEWSVNRTGLRVDPLGWKVFRPTRPGESVEFACLVKDGRGNPATFAGQASLVELTWNEVWLNTEGEIVTGAALAKARKDRGLAVDDDRLSSWKKLHANYARRVVETAPVETSADGLVRAKFDLPHAGLFQLELSRRGIAIPMERTGMENLPLSVVAADETTGNLAVAPGFYLLGPAKIQPGTPLRLLTIVPDGIGPCALAVSGESNHVVRRIEFANSVAWIEVTDLPRFAGGGTAAIASLSDPSMRAAEHNFDFVDHSSRIALVVKARDAESRPGAEVEAVLRAIDSSGKPQRSEIVLGVTDEAVRKLAGNFDYSEGNQKFSDYRLVGSIDVTHSIQDRKAQFRISTGDPRPGAVRSPYRTMLDADVVVLSPFEVASSRDEFVAEMPRVEAFVQGMPPPPPPGFEVAAPPIITRRFFAFTAAWMPEIVTDPNGEARVSFKYPDNLTQWRFDAYAVGADGNTFGRTSILTRTSLPLQARIQAPRFLIEGDRSDVGVLLLNRTDDPLTAEASLAVEGAATIRRSNRAVKKGVEVPQQGEARVTWPVEANEVGYAKVTTTSRAGDLGDAMEIPLPVLPDGFWQETAASGRLGAGSNEQVLKLLLPDPLDPEKVDVKLKVSHGHVPALLDSLPYLVDYPYGCVEQTMSRFLPALVVRHTLVELGLDEEDVESRIVAKESASDRARRERTAGLLMIDEVAEKSLSKLAEAQSWGGGFGWWPGQSAIDPWMTAYVVWGLALARDSDFEVPEEMEENARDAMCGWISRTENTTDVLAWSLFAASQSELEDKQSESVAKVFTRVMTERSRLGPSGRACLALAAKRWGSDEDQATLVRNLENGAEHSQAAGLGATVHWGSTSGYWRGTDGAVECTALTLLALEAHDGKHPLIEPAANWLALNRRSARWSNTRDTALAVLALSKVVANGPSLDSSASIEIASNKSAPSRLAITREALLADELSVTLPAKALKPGENSIRIRLLSGEGPVYALALASSWAQNESAEPSGHLVEAGRGFDRRVPVPMVSGTMRFTSESIASGGTVNAGEEVIAVITLTVPNELEYLAVEVPKPAGCEPLNPLSGWDARIRNLDSPPDKKGNVDPGTPIYREEHDDRGVFFLDHIEAGKWEIRFGMRATTA
ncbi:MAG TPA: MG2 domain-containing protein, partial [Opitutaceae bacterium]|nr:MG2 domain-containing protein [Opitutaceae bacterium]